MPRRPRVFIEGLRYHVYNRVGRGERPFREGREVERFLAVVREAKRRDELTVLAWCVMSNHYHLALRTAQVPLWRTMRYIQHSYTLDLNRRRKVKGPLWQARYKARAVVGQRDLDGLVAYIHLNPVSAGVVRDPGRYRWSGHLDLLGRRAGGAARGCRRGAGTLRGGAGGGSPGVGGDAQGDAERAVDRPDAGTAAVVGRAE